MLLFPAIHNVVVEVGTLATRAIFSRVKSRLRSSQGCTTDLRTFTRWALSLFAPLQFSDS